MIQTVTRQFSDHSVTVSQLPATRALTLTAKLGKLFGAPLARALSAVDTSNLGEMDVRVLGAGIATLFEGVTEAELESLARTLLSNALLDNAPFLTTCDVKLAGKIDIYFQVLLFALEVNYGSFFDVLRALGAAQAAKARAPESTSAANA